MHGKEKLCDCKHNAGLTISGAACQFHKEMKPNLLKLFMCKTAMHGTDFLELESTNIWPELELLSAQIVLAIARK